MHTADVAAAASLLYAPATHGTHAESPATSLYAPALHTVHTREVEAAERLPYVPTTHEVHTKEDCAAAWFPYEPAAQAAHPLRGRLSWEHEKVVGKLLMVLVYAVPKSASDTLTPSGPHRVTTI